MMEVVRPHVDLEVDPGTPIIINHKHNNSYSYDGNKRTASATSSSSSTTYHGVRFMPVPPGRPETISGLERWAPPSHRRGPQWLLPAVIGAVVAALLVGAAVGGGLGATLGSCRNDLRNTRSQLSALLLSTNPESSATGTTQQSSPACTGSGSSTSTTTNGLLVGYKVPVPAMVETLSMDCLALASREQASSQNEKFTVHCGKDMGSGSRRAEGGGTVKVADMASFVAYDFASCLDACSSVNIFAKRQKSANKCQAVTFRWDLASVYARNKANCWLKNATGTVDGAKGCDSCLMAVKVG
ncbi:hypothetical protein Micbo1qcDRAFT_209058 [Microdochium bolleyi]|uniref:Apple domain-containing protein n=1 Tax=Microdochium bolleyi TaxID=196109 RepID=A0A136IN33_9PEZI|nr:hypothetical protein Micbo1qcDRAFT_209058 [Microdochium bolleyi]